MFHRFGSEQRDVKNKLVDLIKTDDTSAWKYFLRSDNRKFNKCAMCEAVFKHGGSTTGMEHLRSVHNIDLQQMRKESNPIGANVSVIDGDLFHVIKVSRLHMGAYLCIASNGIPPSISKQIEMKVQFPPMMTIPHQLEGAYVGQEVILECHTEAHPKSINYWTNERGDMIISGEKFESVLVDAHYRSFMRLKIRNLTIDDFGAYKCVAKNSLGETDGNIKLYEIPAPSTTTVVSVVRSTLAPHRKFRKKDKAINNEVVSDSEIDIWTSNKGHLSPNFEDLRNQRIPGDKSVSSSSISMILRRGGGVGPNSMTFGTSLLMHLRQKLPSFLNRLLPLAILPHISSCLVTFHGSSCGMSLMCLCITFILAFCNVFH